MPPLEFRLILPDAVIPILPPATDATGEPMRAPTLPAFSVTLPPLLIVILVATPPKALAPIAAPETAPPLTVTSPMSSTLNSSAQANSFRCHILAPAKKPEVVSTCDRHCGRRDGLCRRLDSGRIVKAASTREDLHGAGSYGLAAEDRADQGRITAARCGRVVTSTASASCQRNRRGKR